jgi:hypothetical protein
MEQGKRGNEELGRLGRSKLLIFDRVHHRQPWGLREVHFFILTHLFRPIKDKCNTMSWEFTSALNITMLICLVDDLIS